MTEQNEKQQRKHHWENVYQKKEDQEVSWYQETPGPSLELIQSLDLPRDAAIIDVGCGNSNLPRELLKMGYSHLTALDISAAALERTKQKMGPDAAQIQWVVSDILDYQGPGNNQSDNGFHLWHDRAAFHFLTTPQDIKTYVNIATQNIRPSGYLIIAAFALSGPPKCSGLDTIRYSADSIGTVFGEHFTLLKSMQSQHLTPFNTTQDFIFALFQKQPT